LFGKPIMAEILLENISKHYGKVVAVNDISIKIADGESVVLLGPSGCGKTTLLRCIAGLEKLDGGKIFIDGNLVNELTPRERDLSMVFQNYALFPLMTAFDNIAFPLTIRGKSKSEITNQVNETAKLLQIENLLQKTPRQLSGGEQQRVAIGRAIARQPKAFLMDEPLSNLDAPTRVQMRTELKRIQREVGVTTIYVTHDQSEAMVLGDQIGVMKKGELLQFDTPDNVYSNPSNTFVASFIGSPPANLAEVTLIEESGLNYLKGSGIKYPVSTDRAQQISAKNVMNELILSIRSEDMQISKEFSPPDKSQIAEGDVQLKETFGAYALAEVKISDGVSFKVSVSRDFKLSVGEHVSIDRVDDKIHIFEKSTGKCLV
jgi:multiple sugar transport system ATP-binding protein